MSKKNILLSKWDKLMMAVTFAEAGEADFARDIMDSSQQKQKRQEKNIEEQKTKRPELRL